jgi:predicted dienelactone hydrolase
LGLAVVLTVAQAAQIRTVGFEKIRVANPPEAPLKGGVWYPASSGNPAAATSWPGVYSNVAVTGGHLPLIVLSHGGGGSYDGHYDTAIALAHAGFVVAAIDHAGDTYYDQSKVMQLWRRPQQLHRLISYMLEGWPEHRLLDDSRVGAFGFSNGGFTVLVAAGGIPDLSRIGPYCGQHPDHDLCTAMKSMGVDPRNPPIHVPKGAWVADPRIKAIVAAAPAFGFTFGRRGLRNVRIPVELWHAANDRHQPDPYYEAAVRKALPLPPEYRVAAGAGHYDFLPPCDKRLAASKPLICSDPPGFDRTAFHAKLNAEIVRFFRVHLDGILQPGS